jgi:hypothetical protein
MKDKKQEAIKEISEVFKFELWLRFYFIQENDGKLLLDLDEQVIDKMKKEYGHLAELASDMNKTELNPVVCQEYIVRHLTGHFEGKKYEIGYVPKVLDSVAFKAELQLFNTWAHLYEDQLDKNTLGFEKWKKLYDDWRESESARKIELSLSMHESQQKSGQVQSEKTN